MVEYNEIYIYVKHYVDDEHESSNVASEEELAKNYF